MNILEFDATPEDHAAAERISKIVGVPYFTFNLPLQISFFKKDDSQPDGEILNYMPMKYACKEMSFEELFGTNAPSEEVLKDFATTTIAILKNLTKQWEMVRDGSLDMVYYPNISLESALADDEGHNPIGK